MTRAASSLRILAACVLALAPACESPPGGSRDGGAPANEGGVDASTGFPQRLSEAGLYADFAARTLEEGVLPFTPRHVLWSDGADKQRWIKLPAGQRIDSSNMDHWQFPVGTRFFKEFSRGGTLLETRLIMRTGPGNMDYLMGAYVWNGDGSDALFAEHGADNVNGTEHDVPSAARCWSCHVGEPGRILGFSAVQLSKSTPAPTLQSLALAGWLTAPPAAGQDFPVPGDAVTSAALGYLHANCGHCHATTGSARPDTDMILRVMTSERTPAATGAYRTAVGQLLGVYQHVTISHRIVAGDPGASGVLYRMSRRGDAGQMPPLASEQIDPIGTSLVRDWITTLPGQ